MIAVVIAGGAYLYLTNSEEPENLARVDSQKVAQKCDDSLPRPEFTKDATYGDFVFDHQVDNKNCRAMYYFTGTATISGTYIRDENDGTPYFTIDEKDVAKMPVAKRDFWRSADLEQLFSRSAENTYGPDGMETGRATLTITNPIIGGTFIATDAITPNMFTIVEVISKEPIR